jgi:hypothetical protein
MIKSYKILSLKHNKLNIKIITFTELNMVPFAS